MGESKLLAILDREQREDLFDLKREQLDTMAQRVATLAKLYTSALHVVAGPERAGDGRAQRLGGAGHQDHPR